MLQRILSLLGIGSYMPSSFGGGGNPNEPEDLDGRGEARFSFTPGQRLPGDEAESEDERRERITDEDLVWPGKTTTIGFPNEEQVAVRFQLSITDLDPSWYVLRPPTGGTLLPDGSVLLQPGEEVAFEVCFIPPPAAGRAPEAQRNTRRVRNFSFVVSRFDPRRVSDPGQIIGDLPARWVPLPDASDLQLSAQPRLVVIRPWRRVPRFQLRMENRSYLPATLHMRVLRAATRDTLDEGKAEPVGSFQQSLPARTPGVWECQLPPSSLRNSYLATIQGRARVAEGDAERPLALPQPVYVRYVPWLRAFRDWAALLGGLFLLLWFTWGIPVRKAPTVRLKMELPAGTPADASPDDLKVVLIPFVGKTESNPVSGTLNENENGVWEFELPAAWYARNPWGWNWLSREPQGFRVEVNVRNEDTKEPWESRYDLQKVRSEKGERKFELPAEERPFWGAWEVSRTAVVTLKKDVLVKLVLEDLGAARDQVEEIEVTATINGTPVQNLNREKFAIQPGVRELAPELALGVKPGIAEKLSLRVTARTLPYQIEATPWVSFVERKKEPYEIQLRFPRKLAMATLHFPSIGVPYRVRLDDPLHPPPPPPISIESNRTATQDWPIRREGQPLQVQIETPEGRLLSSSQYALYTAPERRDVWVVVNGQQAPPPTPIKQPPSPGETSDTTGSGGPTQPPTPTPSPGATVAGSKEPSPTQPEQVAPSTRPTPQGATTPQRMTKTQGTTPPPAVAPTPPEQVASVGQVAPAGQPTLGGTTTPQRTTKTQGTTPPPAVALTPQRQVAPPGAKRPVTPHGLENPKTQKQRIAYYRYLVAQYKAQASENLARLNLARKYLPRGAADTLEAKKYRELKQWNLIQAHQYKLLLNEAERSERSRSRQ